MKSNIFKTKRHQTDHINDFYNDVHVLENYHDDAFQMIDTEPTHPQKGWGDKKEEKGKKEAKQKKTVRNKKAPVAAKPKDKAPMACSPDEKVEEFNRQARRGVGKKDTAINKKK